MTEGHVDEKVSRRDKAKALAAAARGRYRRFKNRVKSLRLRKRTAPPTGISDFWADPVVRMKVNYRI